jgi:hypothetical protein
MRPPSDPAPQAAAGRAPLAGLPALGLVRPLAALAVLATLLGRMIAPAAAGIAVGAGKLVRALELTGGALSQLFAVASIVVAMALLGAFARSEAPYGLRVGAILAASFVILIVLNATVQRVPDLSSALIAVIAALLALGAAWDARRAPFARPVALALGLVGLGALARLGGVALAIRAADGPRPALAGPARGFATAGFVIDGLAVLIAVAALAARGKPRDPKGDDGNPSPLARPATILALVVAFLLTRQALAGGGEDATAFDVLLRRALDRLLPRPAPLLPVPAQIFAAALSLVAAISALIARRDVPALSGALALVLVARSAPDAPLGALSLVIAAFSVALAARDDRGLWAAILAGGGAREGAPAHAPAAGGANPAASVGGGAGAREREEGGAERGEAPPDPSAPAPEGVRQVDAEDDVH